MSTEDLIPVMAGLVLVCAGALVMQALLLLALYRTSKASRDHIANLAGRADSLVQSIQSTLETTRRQVAEVSTKTSQVLDLTKTQLVRIDEVLGDATTRAKVQLDRVELILDDTISRVHATANAIQTGILRPLREMNGLAAGLRTMLSFLFHGRTISVERATHDEEMFI
jgi:hypothetical protein